MPHSIDLNALSDAALHAIDSDTPAELAAKATARFAKYRHLADRLNLRLETRQGDRRRREEKRIRASLALLASRAAYAADVMHAIADACLHPNMKELSHVA